MAHGQLSRKERYAIGGLKARGWSLREIGTRLDRSASTISREIERNSCADGYYRPDKAHARALNRRWSTRKKDQYSQQEWAAVQEWLRQDWSPEQVVGAMPRRRRGRRMSLQTMYRRIHRDRRQGGQLWRHMRHLGKYARKRRGSPATRGRLAGKRHISERPKRVQSRRQVGHCEVDTVMGADQAGPCVLTVVERVTGYLVVQLLQARTKEEAGDGLCRAIMKMKGVMKTITADNGTEFHGYEEVEEQFKVPFYFATPYHSWERGTNENTNGLLRQYLPKGASFKDLTQAECDRIAARLNTRPRKRLAFVTPAQALTRRAGVAFQV